MLPPEKPYTYRSSSGYFEKSTHLQDESILLTAALYSVSWSSSKVAVPASVDASCVLQGAESNILIVFV